MYQVQIKFMNFQRRYLVKNTILLSFYFVVILFQLLNLLPFSFSTLLFLTHFNLTKVINIYSPSQTFAGQYSSEKIQLLSLRFLNLICFSGSFFHLSSGLKIRWMLLIVVHFR